MERNWKSFSPESFKKQIGFFGRKKFKDQMAQAIEYGYGQWKIQH